MKLVFVVGLLAGVLAYYYLSRSPAVCHQLETLCFADDGTVLCSKRQPVPATDAGPKKLSEYGDPRRNVGDVEGFSEWLMLEAKFPRVLLNSPVKQWPAMDKWTPSYLSSIYKNFSLHLPLRSTVRMHR